MESQSALGRGKPRKLIAGLNVLEVAVRYLRPLETKLGFLAV